VPQYRCFQANRTDRQLRRRHINIGYRLQDLIDERGQVAGADPVAG
jgi:hypothetical protein